MSLSEIIPIKARQFLKDFIALIEDDGIDRGLALNLAFISINFDSIKDIDNTSDEELVDMIDIFFPVLRHMIQSGMNLME
jgi:hypothetical protein